MHHAQPDPFEIDVYRPVPILFRIIRKIFFYLNAGVIYGTIQPSVCIYCLLKEIFYSCGFGYIRLNKDTFTAGLF